MNRYDVPTPMPDRNNSLTFASLPHTGGPLEHIYDRFRRLNVEQRARVFDAISDLFRAQGGAADAKVSLELKLERIKNLDELRAFEAFRIQVEIDTQREKLTVEADTQRAKLMAEKLKAEMELYDLQQQYDRKRNPPESRRDPRDPNLEALAATLRGGKYAQHADKFVNDYVKEHGGEANLTEEDREYIRNCYHFASVLDESKGRAR